MAEARFQTFDDASERAHSAARVAALRAELKRRGLDGMAVPRADRQQNEYLPASEQRLAWLTGFTGSAGVAVVLSDKAALFVDGRYTVQATAQTDAAVFTIAHLVDTPPEQWLEQNLERGAKFGYDPWLHTSDGAEKLRKACANAGAELVAIEDNPIDALWRDRPAPPRGRVVAARSQIRRRERGRQAPARPRGTEKIARRYAAGVRSAERRMDLQHPRLGYRAYAAGARLRRRSARGSPGALCG